MPDLEAAHQAAQEIAIELWQAVPGLSRVRCVNDAFDAVEETTGLDLSEHRKSEIKHAEEYEANDDNTS